MITFKSLREKANITQQELAKKVNVHVTCIQKYEYYIRVPARKVQNNLKKALGCTDQEFEQAIINSMLNSTKKKNQKDGLI